MDTCAPGVTRRHTVQKYMDTSQIRTQKPCPEISKYHTALRSRNWHLDGSDVFTGCSAIATAIATRARCAAAVRSHNTSQDPQVVTRNEDEGATLRHRKQYINILSSWYATLLSAAETLSTGLALARGHHQCHPGSAHGWKCMLRSLPWSGIVWILFSLLPRSLDGHITRGTTSYVRNATKKAKKKE